MKRIGFIYWLTGFCVLCSCNSKAENDAQQSAIFEARDSIAETPAEIMVKELAAEDIKIEKETEKVEDKKFEENKKQGEIEKEMHMTVQIRI